MRKFLETEGSTKNYDKVLEDFLKLINRKIYNIFSNNRAMRVLDNIEKKLEILTTTSKEAIKILANAAESLVLERIVDNKFVEEKLSLFDGKSLFKRLQYLEKRDPAARSILGFEKEGSGRQPWIDELKNCLPKDKSGGNDNEVEEAFLELMNKKIDAITKLFYVK